MYRRNHPGQLEFPDFYLPFSGKLDPDNRWVQLAELVPWELAERIYHAQLCEDFGAPIVSARTALGALIIKERLGLTDRETVETIRENPFLQYFIGLEEFTQERPFDASLMVDFRKRFGEEGMQQIAEAIALASLDQAGSDNVSQATPNDEDQHDDSPQPPSANLDEGVSETDTPVKTEDQTASSETTNRGSLLSDATCAPADIRYPTDVSLLSEAREKTDRIIDALHAPLVGLAKRPRTYRQRGRRDFIAFTKLKKPGKKRVRKAKRQQLGYLGRNLRAIDRLLTNAAALPLEHLWNRWYKHLLVCRELYRQQLEMFETKTHRVDDRIVSIAQPHVRPIKRGKAGRDTEFGAKLTISVVDGFSMVDRLSWDSYNEGCDLIAQVESYRLRLGFYPESVHVDKIYRTRANRAFCKSKGIRMSGPPLGRPRQNISLAERKQTRADEVLRNAVEGKFGEAKRRYGLGRVMAKLASTSAAQISLTFLVMNLELALRRMFLWLLYLLSVQPHGRSSESFITACIRAIDSKTKPAQAQTDQ